MNFFGLKTEGAAKEKIKREMEEFWKRKFRGCTAAMRTLKQALPSAYEVAREQERGCPQIFYSLPLQIILHHHNQSKIAFVRVNAHSAEFIERFRIQF